MTATTSTSRIDASCRLPLFVLFGGAAVWLALGSVFGLIASLTFHNPSMFADCAPLSYGRALAAWQTLLVYGFCIPSGLGVGLWLFARLGRIGVAKPWLLVVGAKLWHLGVLVGLVAILVGQGTGYEWFAMPYYAAAILFLGYLLLAVWTFVTYTQRSEPGLYPSQWFFLAALFWFPWIFSTALLLLHYFPVRGMVQASIAWWFSGNLLNVWLTLAGLASTFYIIPKLTDRPLQSRYLALFVFFTLLLFGTWTGIPASAPLPAWMPALSSGAGLMLLVPIAAVVVMMVQTCRGANVPSAGGPLCFTKFGVLSLVVATVLFAAGACPEVARITDFTWFGRGENVLRLHGFFMMTMLGAAYYILPRVAGIEISRARIRVNFWLGVIGTVVFSLPLVLGGLRQGFALADATVPFLDTAKAAIMYFRLSTLGETCLLVGNFLFLFNVGAVVIHYYRLVCKSVYVEATTLELEPAEVKA